MSNSLDEDVYADIPDLLGELDLCWGDVDAVNEELQDELASAGRSSGDPSPSDDDVTEANSLVQKLIKIFARDGMDMAAALAEATAAVRASSVKDNAALVMDVLRSHGWTGDRSGEFDGAVDRTSLLASLRAAWMPPDAESSGFTARRFGMHGLSRPPSGSSNKKRKKRRELPYPSPIVCSVDPQAPNSAVNVAKRRRDTPHWLLMSWMRPKPMDGPCINQPLHELLVHPRLDLALALSRAGLHDESGMRSADAQLALWLVVVLGDDAVLLQQFVEQLIQTEVESQSSPTTLFRSNGMVTKVMTAVARMLCPDYLRSVVGPVVLKYIQQRSAREACPPSPPKPSPPPYALRGGNEHLHGAEAMLGSLGASEGARMMASRRLRSRSVEGRTRAKTSSLDANVLFDTGEGDEDEHYLDFAQEVFKAITASEPSTPPIIRQISHAIHREVAKKFPGHALTAVGGFVFLRLFVPAIVAPEKHLFDDVPVPGHVRRDLVSVSKIIQRLANTANATEQSNSSHAEGETHAATMPMSVPGAGSIPSLAVAYPQDVSEMLEYFTAVSAACEGNYRVDFADKQEHLELRDEALVGVLGYATTHLHALALELNAEFTDTVTYNVLSTLKSLAKRTLKSTTSPNIIKQFSETVCGHDGVFLESLVDLEVTRPQSPKGQISREEFAFAVVRLLWLFGDAEKFVTDVMTEALTKRPIIDDVFDASMAGAFVVAFLRVVGEQYAQRVLTVGVEHVAERDDLDEICRAMADAELTEGTDQQHRNIYVAELLNIGLIFTSNIQNSAADVPAPLRRVCHTITTLCGSTDDALGGRLVVQRLLCRAIMDPATYNLTQEKPEGKVYRILVMISDALNHVISRTNFSSTGATMFKPQGPAMEDLNMFIDTHGPWMDEFTKKIEEVPDAPLDNNRGAVVKYVRASHKEDAARCVARATMKHLKHLAARHGTMTSTETISYKVFDRVSATVAMGRLERSES